MTFYEINKRYKHSSFLVRLFICLRWFYTPYSSIASHFPREGKILDLGCGHGLLSIALALTSSKRYVIGIDHDVHRIADAVTASKDIVNISFSTGTISVLKPINLSTLQSTNFSGVALLDFLHYFPLNIQDELLKNAHGSLQSGGILVFREVDKDAGVVSLLNRLYEKFAVTVKFTKAEQLFFRTKSEWIIQAENNGFHVECILQHKFPFRDVLFICRK